MATIIKVNGQTITIAPKTAASTESLSASIESLGNSIDKDLAQLNVIGNVQAMEAFGYKATEAVMDKVKEVAGNVWTKIKEMFRKLVGFLKDIVDKFKEIVNSVTKTGIDKNFNEMRLNRADFESVLKGASGETFNAKTDLDGCDKILKVAQDSTNLTVRFNQLVKGMNVVQKLKAKTLGEGLPEDFKKESFETALNNGNKVTESVFKDVKTFGEFMGGKSFNDLSSISRVNIQQLPGHSTAASQSFGYAVEINKAIESTESTDDAGNVKVLKIIASSTLAGAKALFKYSNTLTCISRAEKFCISYYNAHKGDAAAANA